MDRDNAIRWAGIAAFVMLCLAVIYVATRTMPNEVAATQTADDRSRAALQAAKNWVSYGRTPWEQRYSPLAQISSSNLARLGLAWWYDIDDQNVVEATPLVIDGAMYVSGPMGKVYARAQRRDGGGTLALRPKGAARDAGPRVLSAGKPGRCGMGRAYFRRCPGRSPGRP